jgi:hypothetical protein
MSYPFKIHRDGRFEKLVLKLQELNICTLQPHKGGKAIVTRDKSRFRNLAYQR